MTDTLDTQIRMLVTELMDSAPQAPSITDIEFLQARRSIDLERAVVDRADPRRQRRRPRRSSVQPSSRGVLTYLGWTRDWRWAIAASIVIAAVVLALTFEFGSSAPSDAMVLKAIQSSPRVASTLFQTVRSTALEVDRAPQGFIDIEYSTNGEADPRTNAFVETTKAIIPGGDPHFGSLTTVSDGSLVYLPCDSSWILIGKKPCLAYPAQSGTASGSSLTFLRYASGPVAQLGEREIDGVETTGYRVSVPVSALAQIAVPSERSLVQYENSTISDVHVEVWSDLRGLPRQLDFTFLVHQPTLSAVLRASEKEQLSYTTTPLKASVANRNTVIVTSSLNAALLLQSQYQNALIAYYKLLYGH